MIKPNSTANNQLLFFVLNTNLQHNQTNNEKLTLEKITIYEFNNIPSNTKLPSIYLVKNKKGIRDKLIINITDIFLLEKKRWKSLYVQRTVYCISSS